MDAAAFDEYQEQQARALDAASGADTDGGDGVIAGNTTSGNLTGTGHPKNQTGVCPACHRTFMKHSNNQIYDRAECRRKASRKESAPTE